MTTATDVTAFATANGIDASHAQRLVERCGSPAAALRRLQARVRSERSRVLRRHEQMWFEREALRREAAYLAMRDIAAAERRVERERRTLGHRLDAVLAQFARCATISAASNGNGHTQPDSAPPPAVDVPQVGPRLTLMRWHIEHLEELLDQLRGVAPPTHLTAEQKDELIRTRFVGVPSRMLARDVPELGSQRTIERVRVAAGQRPSNGTTIA